MQQASQILHQTLNGAVVTCESCSCLKCVKIFFLCSVIDSTQVYMYPVQNGYCCIFAVCCLPFGTNGPASP